MPTPWASTQTVNCWLVDDDPLTLVDGGLNSASCLCLLEEALAAHDRRVEDLERIVITHHHVDHIGLLSALTTRSDAEIVVPCLSEAWVSDYDNRIDADTAFLLDTLSRHGVPAGSVKALSRGLYHERAWGSGVIPDRRVQDGDVLQFASRNWLVLEVPGHSPADTVYFDERRRTLVSGDHLLADAPSVPFITRPLDARAGEHSILEAGLAYHASLERTSELDVALVVPGHGEPFFDHQAVVKGHQTRLARRRTLVRDAIRNAPRTAFDIAQIVWGDYANYEIALTISIVLGHLAVLVTDGDVCALDDDELVRYAA
jgi:glyoxylase-like metal-dependent hydrolase (beta-lactamase superfamily II)